jgi:hypothetical protein
MPEDVTHPATSAEAIGIMISKETMDVIEGMAKGTVLKTIDVSR